MQLEGSSALVVGGAGGLGAATVRRLATAGVHVVIADLAEEAGHALAAELGDRATFRRTEVLAEDSVGDAIALAVRTGTTIYADETVLDEAGLPPEEEPEEEQDEVVEQFREFIDRVNPEDFAS